MLGSTWVSTEECLGLGMNVNDTTPDREAARGISPRERYCATADALRAHRLRARVGLEQERIGFGWVQQALAELRFTGLQDE